MKVVIVLQRKALESALIDMAKPYCCMVCVGVSAFSIQKFAHTAILMRPKNHVPVVIHPLVRNQID